MAVKKDAEPKLSLQDRMMIHYIDLYLRLADRLCVKKVKRELLEISLDTALDDPEFAQTFFDKMTKVKQHSVREIKEFNEISKGMHALLSQVAEKDKQLERRLNEINPRASVGR
jgi:hypothetical protein